ncbi:MAG: CbtA family protein [Oceanospirillaceae bacterium]|nr:CbtA family protein [Oceanospirillaceae bacterium]
MTLRNLILSALLVGVISGLGYGLFQQLQVNPIIYAAEVFEVAEPAADHHTGDAQAAHSHAHSEAWAPDDGLPRILSTLAANISISFAFALIMISLMALHNQKSRKPKVNIYTGIVWGLAAMFCLFGAPSLLGLHPEIPGTNAAALENRQLWWLFCSITSAIGIAVVYYAPIKFKIAGLILAALPHLIGAPMPTEHGFANTDPIAIQALTELSSQFYLMTAIGMLILFISMGALASFSLTKFVDRAD